MAISLGSNLSLHTRLVLDDRTLMDSILEMRDYPENFLPDIGYCFNKEDGKMYVFNRDNESTELTGKWREYNGGGGNAEVVSYENDDYPELTNVALALNSLLDKVNYLEPELTSFTISPSIETYEIGSEITDLQFSWSYNKEIKSQTLTDCTIVTDDRSAVYPSTLSATKTFTLTFSDGQKVKVGSKKISFLPKIYYGCCPEAEYNSEFVLALSDSVLASNPKRNYAFNCGVGEFAYIVCPTSQNFKGDIWVNGFQATMEKVSTISVTNASNYTQSYDVWRFSNDGLGSFVGTVK